MEALQTLSSRPEVAEIARACTAMLGYLAEENPYLLGRTIASILVDNKKNIWLGTVNSGVIRLAPDNNTPTYINTETGLASDKIYDLIDDDFGNVWIATAQGISHVNEEGNVHNHYRSDGIISTDFNRNSGYAASDGTIFMGTNPSQRSVTSKNGAFQGSL